MNRRNFLKGVVGTSAVVLTPNSPAFQLEPEKEIELIVKPEIVTNLDSLSPPFGITAWEITQQKNVSNYYLLGTETTKPVPSFGHSVAFVNFEFYANTWQSLAPVQYAFENSLYIRWQLPSNHGAECIIHGKISEFFIEEQTGEYTKGKISVILLGNNPLKWLS